LPTYEYECPDCGERFEALQRMSDDPITECPNCAEHNVRRVLFAPAIHFKGKGFYSTDYGTRRRGGEGESGSKDGAKDGAGDKAGAASGGDSSGGEKSSGKTVGLDQI
jgi:putative FmdB family regulatory protein